MRLLATAFFTSLLVTGCTATPDNGAVNEQEPRGVAKFADDPRLGEPENRACFVRNIDGFEKNTKDTVVLTVSPNNQYLVEVQPPCIGLEYAQTIALVGRQTCLRSGDRIIVSDRAFSLDDGNPISNRCVVTDIYRWNRNAEADNANAAAGS